MDINPLLIGALTSTLLLSACGGSSGDSDDDITPETPVTPATVPADETTGSETLPTDETPAPTLIFSVSITSTLPLMLVDTSPVDKDSDEEQIFNVHGVPVRDDTVGTIFVDYEMYCESSYLRTSAPTAEIAYDDLINGRPDVVFTIDDVLDDISLTGINAITHQGRQGQEYSYIRRINDSVFDVVGRGRAFYFNADSDNLVQSNILYFECFGFSDTFFDHAPLVDALLNSIEFGGAEIAEFTFSNDANASTTVLTSDGEPL